jgi:hypothetical protein|eukprot:COSAG01_NODE_4697_length_4806_cov_2.403654_7_plen_78_part_00
MASKSIFLSYAGRTVKAQFSGATVADLQGCFESHFPHSRAKFVFYVEDPVRTHLPCARCAPGPTEAAMPGIGGAGRI